MSRSRPLPRPVPEPAGPGRESVWSFPRPARLEPVGLHLCVSFAGRTIAETRRGYRAIETSHPPSYYFPPDDVATGFLVPAARRTLCEWKGGAAYWDVVTDERRADAAAWSYPEPEPSFRAIRGYVAFYPALVDGCYVDGERAAPQDGEFYGGWITSGLAGPFKGPPGTEFW